MSHEINPAVLICIAFMIFFLGWTFGAAINAIPKATTIASAIFAVTLIVCMITLALIV
ncbi:hypothetical protein WDI34_004324 [Salmonella enterica subsp. enterica]|nr:hypothetical protein [Salmonella enterica]EJI0209151.1 hypothetical protein [Salmonella enterica subsp. enterica]